MDTAVIQVVEEQLFAVSRSLDHSIADSASESSKWTSVDNTGTENVRVIPGDKVQKFESAQIQILEKIGDGGQGDVYNAKLAFQVPVAVENNTITSVDVAGWDRKVFAAKIFRGKATSNRYGQWPEEVFGLHGLCRFVCKFYGYSIRESDGPNRPQFCLLMEKYDCSLRESIDKHMMKGTCEGRPFHGPVALSVIIQIAIGMAFLHDLDIVHGDLKAANILVMNIGEDNDTPAGVFIADFDVAPTVIGTQFWRAPEILQALNSKSSAERFVTKSSDVYSFGMTCYEILTGGEPFEGTIRYTDYDAVVSGKRPTLPSNLNHKMKDLLTRCWHHEPDARPSFKEIVSGFQGLVAGTPVLMQLFTLGNTFNGADESDLESNLVKLKELTHVLAEKYNQGSSVLRDTTGDFVLVGLECVDLLEEFKARFGVKSFEGHPPLSPLENLSRYHLSGKIIYKACMFSATCPQVIPEYVPIVSRMKAFLDMLQASLSMSDNTSQDYESLSEEDTTLLLHCYAARKEAIERLVQVDYTNRHEACHQILTDFKRGIVKNDEQPCSFCKGLPFYSTETPKMVSFHLYEDRFSMLKRAFTLLVNFFRNFIFKIVKRDFKKDN